MEEVIEGGPWLYLGQPIVLPKLEPGMELRKLKHTRWMLSMVHPQSTKECPLSKPTKPAVSIYVRKSMPIISAEPDLKLKEKVQAAPVPEENPPSLRLTELARTCRGMTGIRVRILSFLTLLIYCVKLIMKQTARQGVLTNAAPQRVLQNNVTRIQSGLLSRWRWFVDYVGPGNRIWIAWNGELIDVDILNVDSQFVHCLVHIYELHETILITVVYGANDVSARRELWQGLIDLAVTVGNEPWLVEVILMRSVLFRFDNYLALSPGFLASVHSIWRHTIVGTPMYSVTRKLKALKPVFRQQRRCKGDLAMNVKLAAGFLEVAQNILKLDRHNSLLLLLEHCCRLVYLKASKLEQVMLRQRAKLQWLKGGDQCSRIFFRRVATRRSNKRVFQIFDNDGNEQTEPTVISSIFVEFFQDLLGGDRTARAIDLLYLRPWARHILSDDEARAIIRPVTIDEVKTAFFNIEEDKAPGPDGFSSGFLQSCMAGCGRRVAEFRPISCCNVIYKVITKILVSRIRESLDLLISPSQNAFVPGRLISDNILLAQELFSGYNQCRLPPRCALKVDQRKAYDTVEWDFLIATANVWFP
ncbi:hypothetical protein Sango_3076000 [Sesamum angolense]|uniref:Reverse transcriptase domain-containing protein n=1 Tax=Sesamum angolense TaxID=2727404 RepID=A0AAE1TB59_9LAMI|nr:hypothetical protein Sango_3076000 [Sesamum angolense]